MKTLLGKMAGWLGGKPRSATTPAPPAAAHEAFEPHNEIERLLMAASVNPDARPAFQRALLDAKLCAATPETPIISDTRTVGAGEHLSLLNIEGPDGAPVTAIFTAQERIVEVFGTGVGFVAMKGEVILDLVADHGAWLNPGFPYSVHWAPGELREILGKPAPRTPKTDAFKA